MNKKKETSNEQSESIQSDDSENSSKTKNKKDEEKAIDKSKDILLDNYVLLSEAG